MSFEIFRKGENKQRTGVEKIKGKDKEERKNGNGRMRWKRIEQKERGEGRKVKRK